MKLKMYTLHDKAAAAFTTPFFMANDGLAIRAFQDNVNSENSDNITLHPEQFTLYQSGEFDDITGTIIGLEEPKIVAHGIELVNEQKPKYSDADMQTILNAINSLKKDD